MSIPVLPVELVGHIAASSGNPMVIKPMDSKRRAIGKHEGFRRLINPEAKVLFDAGRSTPPWRVYDNYFLCQAVEAATSQCRLGPADEGDQEQCTPSNDAVHCSNFAIARMSTGGHNLTTGPQP